MASFYGDSNRWFIGTVVSIDDPTQLGRIKVRVDGIHGSSILDKDLPFAQTIVPITEGGTQGLGNNLGVQVGARVFGIFLDAQDSQMPLVFGSMPKYEDASAGDRSTPQLARGTNTLTKTLNLAGTIIADPYAAEYPHNKVITTTSGHAIEIDDTPNAERINIHHKSGSFIEFHPDGKIVVKAGKGIFIDAGFDANIKAVDSTIEVTGTLNMTGVKGDVVVDGISLVNHTHRDNPGLAGAVTTPPLK